LRKVEKYLFPKTLAECVSFLDEYKGQARLVSGATDLTLWIKEGKFAPAVLVDVSELPEMRSIKMEDGKMIIGAAMTHAEVAADEMIKKYFKALADGCRSVGSPQIRNVGTLAGNIVSAQPAADSVVPMTAMDAKCEITGSIGSRIQPLSELSKSVGVSNVDPTKEVLTRIFIEIPQCRYGTAFKRIAPREAMALPVVNVAVMLKADEVGKITQARIVASPVSIVPFRAIKAEDFICGERPSSELFIEAAKLAGEEASPRDSLLRGSGAYRKELVRDLVGQALKEASAALV
jgi:carbon-monoxide dehydrogenase medium subunit